MTAKTTVSWETDATFYQPNTIPGLSLQRLDRAQRIVLHLPAALEANAHENPTVLLEDRDDVRHGHDSTRWNHGDARPDFRRLLHRALAFRDTRLMPKANWAKSKRATARGGTRAGRGAAAAFAALALLTLPFAAAAVGPISLNWTETAPF